MARLRGAEPRLDSSRFECHLTEVGTHPVTQLCHALEVLRLVHCVQSHRSTPLAHPVRRTLAISCEAGDPGRVRRRT